MILTGFRVPDARADWAFRADPIYPLRILQDIISVSAMRVKYWSSGHAGPGVHHVSFSNPFFRKITNHALSEIRTGS